jgi:hypothetical protein
MLCVQAAGGRQAGCHQKPTIRRCTARRRAMRRWWRRAGRGELAFQPGDGMQLVNEDAKWLAIRNPPSDDAQPGLWARRRCLARRGTGLHSSLQVVCSLFCWWRVEATLFFDKRKCVWLDSVVMALVACKSSTWLHPSVIRYSCVYVVRIRWFCRRDVWHLCSYMLYVAMFHNFAVLCECLGKEGQSSCQNFNSNKTSMTIYWQIVFW